MHKAFLSRNGSVSLLLVFGLSLFLHPGSLRASDDASQEPKPDRLVVMAAEFPGLEVPPEKDVSMDLIFQNKGRSDESVQVRVTQVPKGWKARVKTYRFDVTGIFVPAEEKKTLTFEASPGKEVTPGAYEFVVEANTPDGQFKMQQAIAVTVKAKEEDTQESKGVKLTTSYPVLRGPSDAKFEFSVEVDSQLDTDAVFDLYSQAPEGWEINFKPAYETKFISSLRIKANQSSTVAVEVKPAASAQAGEYPINIRVNSGDAKGDAKLNVILTGTYGLEVGTPSGLLSLDARQGQPANMSIYIKNTGSAVNNDIKFLSFKPENWKVEFKPENIEGIEPGDFKQVEVIMTPNAEALVGDYSVGVTVEGEKTSKTLEFRVTVRASAAWGWIGIGIIVAVIGGLMGLFRWLGRR